MRFGVYAPTCDGYDVPTLVRLAQDAERTGWDGFFIWDNVLSSFSGDGVLADTTVALAAIATATQHIRFGALVTALARRRPWKFARETTTLDHLSGGRLIVGAGLGGRWDFIPVGEDDDGRVRAALLDEGLEVVAALWSGESTSHEGENFTLDCARVAPRALQQPRIPVWIAGYWPGNAPFVRAARWDGVAPLRAGYEFRQLRPAELRDCVHFIGQHRKVDTAFDVVFIHTATQWEPDLVPGYEAAGATWWLEASFPLTESVAAFNERILAGPPA